MTSREPFAYTDPTDAFGHTLHVTRLDASIYDGDLPVVALGITVPDDATDPDNPVVYVPIADVNRMTAAMLAAAGQAPAPQPPGVASVARLIRPGTGIAYDRDPAPQPETTLDAIAVLEQRLSAEPDHVRASALYDALLEARGKLPCTCARSQGLHSRDCQRYVPGHDLASPDAALKQYRQETAPDAEPGTPDLRQDLADALNEAWPHLMHDDLQHQVADLALDTLRGTRTADLWHGIEALTERLDRALRACVRYRPALAAIGTGAGGGESGTPDLREQYAAAIREAACPEAEDDGCCDDAAPRCFFGHLRPIRWTGTTIVRIDGTPEQFAEACATVRDDALTTAQRERDTAEHVARQNLDHYKRTYRDYQRLEAELVAARSEIDRLRTYATATDLRHTEIRDHLATLDIRTRPDAWSLGAHIIAILDSPPDGLTTALAPRDTEAEGQQDDGKPMQSDAELTIYRAGHESITFGLYTTRAAARAHCEAYIRREFPADVTCTWIPDDGAPDAPEELSVYVGDDRENTTGYVVTPLTVATAYDPDGDE